MLAVLLDTETEAELDALAKVKHSSKNALAQKAILRMLEDEKDLDLIAKASIETTSTKPLAQLRKELGLVG